MTLQLRDYQHRAIQSIYDYYAVKSGNCLVVVPTGGGKSVIIGAFCKGILEQWASQRIIVLSHVKELLEQNFGKIKAFWPEAPAGLYCAGLGQKEARDPITVASIQSVYRKPHAFGWRDLVLIDECHLLSPDSDTMYQRFIEGLRETNPRLKVIGFTATDYRAKTGRLTDDDGLFTDVACEISMAELLENGHISRMIGRRGVEEADMSQVGKIGGEFDKHAMAEAFDKEALTAAALDEVFSMSGGRNSWLFFCSGVKHAEHVRDALIERGVDAATVTGATPPEERAAILKAFKAGEIKAVTNANVLTTGFDAPNIDLIAMLRSTTSPGLFLQMVGRGLRLSPLKDDCLLLDYGGNLERHGCIDQIKPPRVGQKRGGMGERHVPSCLICPDCRMANPLGALECGDCGREFAPPERIRHDVRASDAPVMMGQAAAPDLGEWFTVYNVVYSRHEKAGSFDSLKVEYQCGVNVYREWVCLEHPPGYARTRAVDWWKRRYSADMVPDAIWKAIHLSDLLKKPTRIRVKKKEKFWEITGYDFEIRSIPEAAIIGGPSNLDELDLPF